MNLNISMIEDVLNREVRPLLSQHHGNIIILSYEYFKVPFNRKVL